MINKGMFTSNSSEWSTPQKFYDELNREFQFELDVCSTEENHKCEKFFTKDQDGLSKSWGGIDVIATLLMAEKYQNG